MTKSLYLDNYQTVNENELYFIEGGKWSWKGFAKIVAGVTLIAGGVVYSAYGGDPKLCGASIGVGTGILVNGVQDF